MVKSMNQKVDEAFKGWKRKNPFSDRQIGYWTLKSWRNHSKKSLNDPLKKKQKEYARRMFLKFESAIKKNEAKNQAGGDVEVSINAVSMLLRKQNMGLPKKVFKDNRLAIKGVKPTKKDIEKLAKDIKKAFQTPTHNKGRIGVAVRGFKMYLKQNARMLNGLFGKMNKLMTGLYKGEKKKSDPDFQKKLKEIAESNPEIKTSSKLLAANWVQSTIIPKVATLAGLGAKVSVGSIVATKAAHAAGAVSIATAPSWIPWLAGVAVASLVTGFVFKRIVKKVNQIKGKGQGSSVAYDDLAADIYAGYSTPEAINKEYSSKLDEILTSNKDPDKMRDEILSLYKDFDDNVRPSIDKGVYLLGESEGSEEGAFLKRGENKDLPAFLKLKYLKDQYEAEDLLVEEIETNSEEISKMATDLLSGKTEISKEVLDALKDHSGVLNTKKANARRVANRYYRLSSTFR
jgi:hypothetical protein